MVKKNSVEQFTFAGYVMYLLLVRRERIRCLFVFKTR